MIEVVCCAAGLTRRLIVGAVFAEAVATAVRQMPYRLHVPANNCDVCVVYSETAAEQYSFITVKNDNSKSAHQQVDHKWSSIGCGSL